MYSQACDRPRGEKVSKLINHDQFLSIYELYMDAIVAMVMASDRTVLLTFECHLKMIH